MKDVIIIGTGKAAHLHYNSYKKITNLGKLYFVDKYKVNSKFLDYDIYESIDEVLTTNNINVKNVIIDVCTPRSQFETIIDKCMSLSLNNIIVEKPFIVSSNYFDNKEDLNIRMIENYLYSKITTFCKKFISKNNLKINSIYSNFSKNRIVDSGNGRAMHNNSIPTVFEIEMPHQIYLTNYFVDSDTNINVRYIDSKAMIIDDKKLSRHGYGIIFADKNNTNIIYESDLTSNTLQKKLILVCNNGISISLEYILYDLDMNKIKDGTIAIFQNNKLIKHYIIDEDDMMFYCIQEYYIKLSNNEKFYSSKKDIVDFSTEINRYINYASLND